MRANYLKIAERAQVSKKAMGEYLLRASVDKRIDERIRDHNEARLEELSAIVGSVDANWLYTLHNMKGLKLGKRIWSATGSCSASSTETAMEVTRSSLPGRTLKTRLRLRRYLPLEWIFAHGSGRIFILIARVGR